MSFYNNSATAASNATVGGISAAGSASANLIDDHLRQIYAFQRQILNDLGGANTVGGTADAITITPSSGAISAVFNGLVIGFVAANNNATTSPTANVGGLGAEPIKKNVTGTETALAVGDIQAGSFYWLRWRSAWDSSGGAWELISISGQRDVGEICWFAMNSAPSGFLKANGAAVSRTTYATLFARIGTTFGSGDGSTTFNLPDLRGEFIRGWDDSRGVDTSRTFGSSQSHAYQTHTHNFAGGSNAVGTGTIAPAGQSGNAFTFDASVIMVSGTGNTASETRPRNVALLACIRY